LRDGPCTALLIGLLAALLPDAAVHAQALSLPEVARLYLDDATAGEDGERAVELYLRALTRHGDPIDDLRAPHLDIRDNGERIDPDDVVVSHLGKAYKGVTWVIAIDASRTMMLGEAFERAKAAAIDFLDRIGSHDRVAIVTFAHTVEVVAHFEDSRVDAQIRLEELEVDQSGFSTLFFDGLYESLELIRGGSNLPRRAAVIVFSDGKDAGSSRGLEEVIEFARGSRVLLYSIGYSRLGGAGLETMARLARETDADFFKVGSSSEDLRRFFNVVWERITRSYVVRYPHAMDGKAHTIEVSADGQSAVLKITYPKIAGPVWPWLAGIGGALALAAAVLALLYFRSAGQLVFVDGPRNGENFPLKRGRVRIGAIEANDLVIPTMTVSRYHAEVHVAGSRVEIKDLHSENGTLINGNRVESAPIPLHPGDRIRIADVDLVYER
jgi:VWFA-related protein